MDDSLAPAPGLILRGGGASGLHDLAPADGVTRDAVRPEYQLINAGITRSAGAHSHRVGGVVIEAFHYVWAGLEKFRTMPASTTRCGGGDQNLVSD